jgi:tetratricopeptide (TPR) repeat protein
MNIKWLTMIIAACGAVIFVFEGVFAGEDTAAQPPAKNMLLLEENLPPEFYSDVAKAYSKYGMYNRAIEFFDLAIKRADKGLNAAELYDGLGTAYMRTGKVKEAIQFLEKAVALAPDLASKTDYYYNLASAYQSDGQTDKAIEAFQFVVDSAKESIWKESARRQLFYIYREKNVLEDYIAKFEKQTKDDPKDFNAHLNLAEIYASVKYDAPKAVTYFEKAYELKPDNKNVRDRLAQMYENSRQYDKALNLLKKIAEESEDTMKPYAYQRVSNVYAQLNKREEALQWADKILELEKKDMYYYSLVASIYIRFEDFDRAVALYNKGVEESKGSDQKESLLFQLGNLYERMRKYDKAEETYKKIMDNELKSYYDDIAKSQIERLKQLKGQDEKEKKQGK